MRSDSRRLDLLAVALLGVAITLFFWKLLLSNLILASGDTLIYIYPYWTAAARALQAGQLPLWNPDLFMGAPLLANSQAGVLYPLNWPLWLAFDIPTAAKLSIGLHLWIAAGSTFGLARYGLKLRRPAAWLAGLLFALGGYLTAQVEHVNQLQGIAWMPAVFCLLTSKERPTRPVLLGIVLGLQLLAGHTQSAFITVVGAAVYATWFLWPRAGRRATARPLTDLILGGLFALTLSAAQILPTLELSQHSVRGGGGLPLNEAVSFSLHPLLAGRALLPGYGETLFSEYVAYIPLGALLLALIGSWAGRRRPATVALGLVAALGLLFSLGAANPFYILLVKVIPGFALFRAPARWLVLYAFAAAVLSGVGLDALISGRPLPRRRLLTTWAALLLALAGWSLVAPRLALFPAPPESPVTAPALGTLVGWAIEGLLAVILLSRADVSRTGYLVVIPITLFLASRALPYNHPTAPEAYHALRPAPAYLLAAETALPDTESPTATPPGRFLSISDIFFDPGDMGELASIYADQLDNDAFYDLIIATKQKEILAPNLPLSLGIPAVDGYDGGVLPLANYVATQELLLPAHAVSIDGRLRENLDAVPDGRWLNLFNVRYLVTDKVGDAWSNGVFYDLQVKSVLDERNQSAQVAYLPPFEATGLGIVLNRPDLPAGTPLAMVTVDLGGRKVANHTLTAGVDMSPLRDEPDESTLDVTQWRWPAPGTPVKISIARVTGSDEPVILRGLSLVDERDGTFQSLVLSSQGRYRLVHSGDVKIYENLDTLPRAFLAGRATWVPDNKGALIRMKASDFDPAGLVVLIGEGPESPATTEPLTGEVTITRYEPERIEILVEADGDGWLVVSDAFYPGWKVTVDGKASSMERADLLFRAIPIREGRQEVILIFQPDSVRIGVLGSALAATLCILMLGYARLGVSRREARDDPPL